MTVRALSYTAGDVATFTEADAALEAPGTTWIRVTDPTEAELDAVRALTDVHHLAVEDVLGDVRPKVEEFDRYTFLLVKSARLTAGESTFDEVIRDLPVGLFVGGDWLVSVAPVEVGAVDRAWESVRSGDARALHRGPDFLAYRVVDAVVDGYFDILDAIEDRIERIEDAVVASPGRETLVEINSARRELLSLRKVLWPTREAMAVAARGDPEHVREATEKYYRDVYDHLVQLVDLVETYRELASGARDIYLNVLSASTNEVMKTLTVVATIVLPLTFVVGLFGMNFGDGPYNMPELAWTYGYPAVMLGMVLVTGLLVWHFRRLGWL